MNGSERKEEYEDGFQERTGVPCEDAGLMMWRQECRDSLFSGDGLHCFGFLGFLVAEPGAAGHFHAAFFVHSEALGGDDVAFHKGRNSTRFVRSSCSAALAISSRSFSHWPMVMASWWA